MSQRWEVKTVREYQKQDGSKGTNWITVGSGWTNKDGSINIFLDAIPMDGKLILQIPLSKEERQRRYDGTHGTAHGDNLSSPQSRGQPQQHRGQQNNAQRYRPQQAAPIPAANLFEQDYPEIGGDDDDDAPPFK